MMGILHKALDLFRICSPSNLGVFGSEQFFEPDLWKMVLRHNMTGYDSGW